MKFKLYLLSAVFGMFFSSCQITENIYLEPDGSGKVNYEVDASGLMDAMGGLLAEETAGQNIDSTFTFKALLDEKKDSIAKLPVAEQQRLRELENMKVHMQMDTPQKIFKMELLSDFKQVSQLQNMMEALKTVQNFEKKSNQPENPFGDIIKTDNVELKYAFDGKVFKRTVRVIDPVAQAQAKDTTGMVKMMFANSQYIVKYHFPKKVKSVSNPAAVIGPDKKTVTVPFAMSDYMDEPEKTNLEVVLDKK